MSVASIYLLHSYIGNSRNVFGSIAESESVVAVSAQRLRERLHRTTYSDSQGMGVDMLELEGSVEKNCQSNIRILFQPFHVGFTAGSDINHQYVEVVSAVQCANQHVKSCLLFKKIFFVQTSRWR